VVPGIAGAQFIGIIFSVVLALVTGTIAGMLIKATGTTRLAYEDSDEFTHVEGPEAENMVELEAGGTHV
jgi:ammonium transporter Rh